MSVKPLTVSQSTAVIASAFVLCGLLLLGVGFVSGGEANHLRSVVADPESTMLQVGEELEYKVSYSFFNIGTIRTKVVSKEVQNGRVVYKTRAIMDSSPGLDWLVSLHIRFYSEMDGSIFSYGFTAHDSSKKEAIYRVFRLDYQNKQSFFEGGKLLSSGERKAEVADTTAVTGPCQDGLSLFFYAREHVHQKGQVTIPTLVEKKQENTFINFMNKREDADIDAVDYPVDVIAFDGKADYVGVFGLTGGFRGWFSNDEASVPILARMNVILGSIKIELKQWNRPGWQPPKYVENAQR